VKRLVILLALVSLLAPVAVRAVGFQGVQAPDPQGQPLQLGIWYPSDAATSPQRLGTFEQAVAPNGPVSGQALPLVMISHGTGGSLTSHYDTRARIGRGGVRGGGGDPHSGQFSGPKRRGAHCRPAPADQPGARYILTGWSATTAWTPRGLGFSASRRRLHGPRGGRRPAGLLPDRPALRRSSFRICLHGNGPAQR